MNEFQLTADARTASGKGAVRRLRREGLVPAVLYGAGSDPVSLQVPVNVLTKHLENEAFFSHVLTVSVGGRDTQAVLKDVQRDPASSAVIHIDLQRVSSETELTMHVPLHFVNEDRCVGRRAGGTISHHLVDVEVACLPRNLPEYIEVDLAAIEMGVTIHLSQLALPAGVRLTANVSDAAHDHPVVSVQAPRGESEGAEGEGEAAPGAPTA
ncbi:MAG: 50S ribosomal protein L25/general stress protein Ctc [Chromatiales bacterium]|nr:50S ribosomal protein L25/general stress protein Ctc [Chromatiales bacterium]